MDQIHLSMNNNESEYILLKLFSQFSNEANSIPKTGVHDIVNSFNIWIMCKMKNKRFLSSSKESWHRSKRLVIIWHLPLKTAYTTRLFLHKYTKNVILKSDKATWFIIAINSISYLFCIAGVKRRSYWMCHITEHKPNGQWTMGQYENVFCWFCQVDDSRWIVIYSAVQL